MKTISPTPYMPGIEETKNDILLTEAELKAYTDLESAFLTLANLPGQSRENFNKFTFEARRYRMLSEHCQNFLNKLKEYEARITAEQE